MKKGILIIFLVILVIAVIAIGYSIFSPVYDKGKIWGPPPYNNSTNLDDNNNLCEQVISLDDVKNICSPNFEIIEDTNESYYWEISNVSSLNSTEQMGYDQFPLITENGTQIRVSQYSTTVLLKGTESLCENVIYNGVSLLGGPYNKDTRTLQIEVYKYSSPEFATAAYSFFNNYTEENKASTERTAFEQGNTFGSNYTLSAFPGGEEYDRVYNQTFGSFKSITLQFLKNDKIITLTVLSQKDKDLICNIDNVKKLAAFIDKKL